MAELMDKLIYGKDSRNKILASEVVDNRLVHYRLELDKVVSESEPFYYYVLLQDYDNRVQCGRLDGPNDLMYFVKFTDKQEMYQYTRKLDLDQKKYWKCTNPVESAMLRQGFTHYKGMDVKDLSILSFDIETTGVEINDNSFVLLISNTYRDRNGNITRRLFSFDEYDKPRDFINAWCQWVREMDPDIITGHNIFGFDIPYLVNVAKINKTKLNLGRNASAITVNKYTSEFRKDGSQTYTYNNAQVFGRQLIDTMFLSIKYDVARNYPSYGLKSIIKHEKLEKPDRQFWDFSKVKEPWNNVGDWFKFKQYAKDDADDALALFDLMIPAYFYYTQSIPRSLQEVINTATGSQINLFMLRSYLQDSRSIPLPDEKSVFEGAISIGNPGIYKNVFKVDVASLYPSIMLEYKVENKQKDPQGNFLRAVDWFTAARLENKRLYKETKDRKYKDLSEAQKIVINSFYGFMGAPGLNFNYPDGAAKVTRKGREILTKAIDWSKSKRFNLANADTDSISYEAPNNSDIYEHLEELNRLYPKKIRFENDGVYESVVVVKAKNYAMLDNGKIKIKGSALKATMKEPALVNFLEETIESLLKGDVSRVESVYKEIARNIVTGNIKIEDWCSKKTVTKAVLTSTRTNETRVLDALQGEHFQEGDKIRVFFETPTKLTLDKNYKGIYCKDTLLGKLHATVKVLSPVLDMTKFLNYKLKKNKGLI